MTMVWHLATVIVTGRKSLGGFCSCYSDDVSTTHIDTYWSVKFYSTNECPDKDPVHVITHNSHVDCEKVCGQYNMDDGPKMKNSRNMIIPHSTVELFNQRYRKAVKCKHTTHKYVRSSRL